MRILESERLIMKPVEPADLPYLMEQRWDAALTDHIIHNPISSYDQQQWYERICRNGDVVLSIFFKRPEGEPELLGAVGLYNINMRHQLATVKTMRIPAKYQGLGIASEALGMLIEYGFNTLNLHKITCDTFADNLGTIKHLEKVGLKQEGRLRKHYFHQGEYKDALIYSILREEFSTLKH